MIPTSGVFYYLSGLLLGLPGGYFLCRLIHNERMLRENESALERLREARNLCRDAQRHYARAVEESRKGEGDDRRLH